MVDYTRLAATAKRLVEANGRTVSIVKRNRTAANASQPWRGPGEPPAGAGGGAIITPKVAFVPPSGSGFGKLIQDALGTLLQSFDQVGLVAATSVTGNDLDTFDAVVDGADVWKIVQIGRLKPADDVLLYFLALKR